MRAFATLRFTGDEVDPAQVSEILQTSPTFEYRKGDPYKIRPDAPLSFRKTNLWLLDSAKIIEDLDLKKHVKCLESALSDNLTEYMRDEKFDRIRHYCSDHHVEVLATLFWHGDHQSRPPRASARFANMIAHLNGEVAEDFETDAAPGAFSPATPH